MRLQAFATAAGIGLALGLCVLAIVYPMGRALQYLVLVLVGRPVGTGASMVAAAFLLLSLASTSAPRRP